MASDSLPHLRGRTGGLREHAPRLSRGAAAGRFPWFRLVLLLLAARGFGDRASAGTIRPYYRRAIPAPQRETDFASDTYHVDFSNAHMASYGVENPVAEADRLFQKRVAAAIRASVGIDLGVNIWPQGQPSNGDLTEIKSYGEAAPTIFIPTRKCLAAMAYGDYFPTSAWAEPLREMVARAIRSANPGWAGTFGPGVDAATDLFGDFPEGNYDMTQMFLLPIVYRYYDELPHAAREHLIIELLAHGLVHRPRVPDHWTHGWLPEDWSRAGFVSPLGIHVRIGETENHILMILTATYLTNQLLYQRNPNPDYDNRRNGDEKRPSCTALLLFLLQRMLQNDFSEYNAKNYQSETRTALLNLCSYAYDHEVRLAARLVLDYVSAHVAVSSSDLRRMVPFRRRNEAPFALRLPPDGAVMDVGLLDWTLGADPMSEFFAMQTGHLRAFATPNRTLNRDGFQTRPWEWAIASNGNEAVIEGLSDYRLPRSLHDLFVNDHNRRFFQRLHRHSEGAESDHNADNMEIYAGSPSYLISAGGAPGPWAIDPGPALVQIASYKEVQKQLGVAVTTSFMPTGPGSGLGTHDNARDLIQLSTFSDGFYVQVFDEVRRNSPPCANYGVAPDFACGHRIHLPTSWFNDLPSAPPIERSGKFLFVNRGSSAQGKSSGPGFYLAIFRDGDFQDDVFACLEAFDTWLHPDVTFEQFKSRVRANNPGLSLRSNVETRYTTLNGNRLRFVIWNQGERDSFPYGAKVLGMEYGGGDPADGMGDAGNVTDRFLNGTIMNSPSPAVVEITNPGLGTKLTLDMSDPWRPRRISEAGELEQAGPGSEVWVDFDWSGPSEGDFYHPFHNLTDAIAAVAHGGVIKIVPGTTREVPILPRDKRFRLTAPLGGVRIGAR